MVLGLTFFCPQTQVLAAFLCYGSRVGPALEEQH